MSVGNRKECSCCCHETYITSSSSFVMAVVFWGVGASSIPPISCTSYLQIFFVVIVCSPTGNIYLTFLGSYNNHHQTKTSNYPHPSR